MPEAPDDRTAFAEELLARPPFHAWLKPHVVAVDAVADTVTTGLAYQPGFSRSPDRPDYHGGIIATLIDIAGHAALAVKLGHRVPTVDMRVDFLRPAIGSDLRAVARVLRVGRTVGVTDVEVIDDAGRAIAAGRCLFSTRVE
jgi:uncharacterized protein (TIGR00369 family)